MSNSLLTLYNLYIVFHDCTVRSIYIPSGVAYVEKYEVAQNTFSCIRSRVTSRGSEFYIGAITIGHSCLEN